MALSEIRQVSPAEMDRYAAQHVEQTQEERLKTERVTARIVAASEHTRRLLEDNHLLEQFPNLNPGSRMGHILFLRLQAQMVAGQADLPLFDRFLRKIGTGQTEEEANVDIELASCSLENQVDTFIGQIPDELERATAQLALERTDAILPSIAPTGKLHEGKHFSASERRGFAILNEQYGHFTGKNPSR